MYVRVDRAEEKMILQSACNDDDDERVPGKASPLLLAMLTDRVRCHLVVSEHLFDKISNALAIL